MALYLFLSLLIIVLLILTLLQYLNTNRIVDQQLTQHKMMFPNQIRRARSVYMRGIFRANHRQRNLRTTAIVSDILAAICLVNAVVVHFQPDSTVSLGNSLLRGQALHVSSQLNTTIQNTSLVGRKLAITYKRGSDVGQLTKNVVKQLKKSGSEHRSGSYEYFDYGELLKGIGNVISGLTLFVSAIAGISLLIAGVGVMNMMYISASERSQEIGIRMAVGATPAEIMKQFLLESVMLTLTGGIIGLLVGAMDAWLIAMFLPFKPVVTVGSIVGTFAISSIVGIVFGLLPAKSAANKNLIDILKS